MSSLRDVCVLPQTLISDICLIGGTALTIALRYPLRPTPFGLSLSEMWDKIYPMKKSKIFRKLSYFSDKEGKTRVIAILDYWSQTCLRPIHDALNSILKEIKQDCTYDQGSFYNKLPRNVTYHSLDLSNATDRMPVSLQEFILSEVIGSEKAAAWRRILTAYAYSTPGHPDVTYNAGQPMGAYSSWPAMALTHHYIVRLAAHRVGLFNFQDYVILGDDIVIANDAVALQYRKLLSTLDMPLSEAKTHSSKELYEFAKRWIYHGVEVTGFSSAGLLTTWKRYSLLHEFLVNQATHGWHIPAEEHPALVSSIYNLMGRFEQSKRVIKLYMVYHYVQDCLKSWETDHAKLSYSLGYLYYWITKLALPSSWLLTLSQESDGLYDLLFDHIVQAKSSIVERDTKRLFETNEKVLVKTSNDLNAAFAQQFGGKAVQAYRQLLREGHPTLHVVQGLLIECSRIMSTLQSDPTVNLLNVGVSKHFIAGSIFSERSSRSIILAQSEVTKRLLDLIREHEVPCEG